MKLRKGLNFLLLALTLASGFLGFKFYPQTELKHNDAPEGNSNNSLTSTEVTGEETATQACPSLFSQSTDKYLASAQNKEAAQERCFVGGCGGSL